jgi:CBS domain containing-hemolysin-like protein
MEQNFTQDAINIGITVLMIILNGFFVAAEFALVKLNQSKVNMLVKEKRPFATVASWLFKRQNLALSACQLGITMASLALGWIGEPAVAHLITPFIHQFGIESITLIHGIAFTIAFTLITSLHIIIGEQVPKIYAIRKPSQVFIWSALILKGFYLVLYPFMYILNSITMVILKWLGVDGANEHDAPLSEEEIQASLSLSHASGELTKNEHRLINAVFKFDDEVVRHIMLPRGDVKFLDISDPFAKNLKHMKESHHTRFPLCEDSLDKVIGMIHVKDVFGYDHEDKIDLRKMARKPLYFPENMRIGQLLQEFRLAKQHFAFVQDEHGTILGIVTMEDVLEELVGSVQDEFDMEEPDMVREAENKYLVDGDVQIADINAKFTTQLITEDAETISGMIVEKIGHKNLKGKKVQLDDGVFAEVVEAEGIRATKVRLIIEGQTED